MAVTPPKRFMDMDTREILSLADPTPDYEEIQSYWPKPQVNWSDHAAAVSRLRKYTELGEEMDEKDPLVDETDVYAPGRDGHRIRIHVWRSKQAPTSGSPLVMLYFGGGYVTGSPTQLGGVARDLVKKFNAVVTAPAYRLAPEHRFPASINDCWDSLQWAAANATTVLKADPSAGFVVGGISAGALAATVVCHLARDEQMTPKSTGVWFSCGSARMPEGSVLEEKHAKRLLSRTQEEVLNDPLLSKDMLKLFRECLKPDMRSKLYSPMIWPGEENHRGLPKTYFQICGLDASRDEAFIYEDILRESGVATRIHLYRGLPHCFYLSLHDLPESRRWLSDTMEEFRWLLQSD